MQQLQNYKKSELGNIPEDWEIKELIELSTRKPQYGAAVSAINKNDSLPRYIRITDINDDGSLRKKDVASITEETAKPYFLNEGDIVFARTGSIGKTYIYSKKDGKCAFAGYLIRFVPNQRLLKIEYLFHYTHSEIYWKWIRSIHTQGVLANINAEQYSRMPIILPPLKEQQKIATILSNVDELIQKIEQIIEQTQKLKKGLMQRLLTKGIGHTKFKKSKLGEIPEEWNIEILGNVLSICQYGLSLALSEKGTFPIFRMNNIENGYMITNDMKYIDLDQKLFEQFKLEKDDILINRTNSIDLVGKLGIFLLEGNYTFASYLIRMRTIKEKILPFFLNLYLNSQKMQYKLKSLATAGVSQANINAVNLKNLQIPLPPLSEQQEIITIILKIDDIFKKTRREKDVLLNLKKSLMQQLLTGKIRVKV